MKYEGWTSLFVGASLQMVTIMTKGSHTNHTIKMLYYSKCCAIASKLDASRLNK